MTGEIVCSHIPLKASIIQQTTMDPNKRLVPKASPRLQKSPSFVFILHVTSRSCAIAVLVIFCGLGLCRWILEPHHLMEIWIGYGLLWRKPQLVGVINNISPSHFHPKKVSGQPGLTFSSFARAFACTWRPAWVCPVALSCDQWISSAWCFFPRVFFLQPFDKELHLSSFIYSLYFLRQTNYLSRCWKPGIWGRPGNQTSPDRGLVGLICLNNTL